MSVDTIFITRTVADHEAAIEWYAQLFGRSYDHAPVPNCREWELKPGVIFQVINQPEKAGSTTFAFGVDDLEGERSRLAGLDFEEAQSFDVKGFDALTYVEYADPEGVTTGLLNAAAPDPTA
ncbi:VOC family protein [Propionibacteriaceae bacterium Y1700]|uniref:VOC family protein n=1 Tax=Microlunatus sp. Y1700 TaxID=3418487 RepID=UPI003DA78247